MSASTTCTTISTINLYCNETESPIYDLDAISSEADLSEVDSLPSSESSVFLNDDAIDTVFDAEIDQMLDSLRVLRVLANPEDSTRCQFAVNWMLKVHGYYRFRPETAYLSVSYFYRFLSSHSLPEGKEWSVQLLAVACLSLAAKIEETSVPLLLDMQILEPRFLFKPLTIQKMELLAMEALNWRLNLTTPFNFLHRFIQLVYPPSISLNSVLSSASALIVRCCAVMSFLEFTPSTIAAAALLWTIDQNIDDSKLECIHKRVNKVMVRRCYELIKHNTISTAASLDMRRKGMHQSTHRYREDSIQSLLD